MHKDIYYRVHLEAGGTSPTPRPHSFLHSKAHLNMSRTKGKERKADQPVLTLSSMFQPSTAVGVTVASCTDPLITLPARDARIPEGATYSTTVTLFRAATS